MQFRTFHGETMYVIEAPEGSRMAVDEGRSDELVVFEEMPGGLIIERRLPSSVVVSAARLGCFGMAIREQRKPWGHPELAASTASHDRPLCTSRITGFMF